MARIVLGVSGGIAAYKAVTLLRLLKKANHEVRVVPTASALKMVGAPTWQAIAGHPVHTSVFDDTTGAEHVTLGQWADLIFVAPATADLLARARQGRADDLLTATLLMARCPVAFAPAMHTEMWEHPATRENVAVLAERGAAIIEPADGPLAGGDSGPGRLPEPEELAERLEELLHDTVFMGPLAGAHVAISAGGTYEPIDPVRFIGNRSTGRQGIALARAARRAGAQVTLVAANVAKNLLAPARFDGATIVEVGTASELEREVRKAAEVADVVVMAAAVADYRPIEASHNKLKKSGDDGRTIELEQTADILRGLAEARRDGQVIVGFAAETGDERRSALEHAAEKARAKGADLLVFNDVGEGRGFGDVPNPIVILDSEGSELMRAEGSKDEVAGVIVSAIVSVRANRLAE